MGSCAAPSAKGDDKFITTDYLQQCQRKSHVKRPGTGKQSIRYVRMWHYRNNGADGPPY
ncbi:replication initiator protein [Escherichia coli]|uniref:Replication initiator protein n=1 Tax=Escherichia coli TaxID=562 RepID=A0A5B9AGW2_ECOLX|nr:replication initiator protein [Escherichia coli]KAB0173999.1 replication initiator protein [Escherichia coli]MBQ4726336.1 replication initiator protein [Escherichia coli]MCH7128382.1 replication initiator protein [Escherichia coli]MDI4387283.1 replication initiator protein [Escherichia coli]